MKKQKEEKNFTYILKCSDGTFYTGWTNDLKKRLKAHNEGKGQNIRRPGVRWLCSTTKYLLPGKRRCGGSIRSSVFPGNAKKN